jgi:hypothetical protein
MNRLLLSSIKQIHCPPKAHKDLAAAPIFSLVSATCSLPVMAELFPCFPPVILLLFLPSPTMRVLSEAIGNKGVLRGQVWAETRDSPCFFLIIRDYQGASTPVQTYFFFFGM